MGNRVARQMRGLKKRRKFTRALRGQKKGSNQKLSNFDYQAFREEQNMQAHVNARQVQEVIAPAKARSPLSKVKKERGLLRASLEASATKRRKLEEKSQRDSKRIATLRAHNNQLMQDILCERRTSNKLIDEAMSDARRLSRQAVQMMNNATAKTVQAGQSNTTIKSTTVAATMAAAVKVIDDDKDFIVIISDV